MSIISNFGTKTADIPNPSSRLAGLSLSSSHNDKQSQNMCKFGSEEEVHLIYHCEYKYKVRNDLRGCL